MEDIKEKNLIREFLNGNKKVFEDLVKMYYSEVYCLCYYYVKDKAGSEDLCQEIFYSVYKNLHTFRWEVPFKVWLFKITYNKSMDFLRKKPELEKVRYSGEENFQVSETLQYKATGSEGYLSDDLKRIINSVVSQLPERTRTIVELFYYSGLSCKEIAQICDMSEGAVKTALSRAREMLKEKLIFYYKG